MSSGKGWDVPGTNAELIAWGKMLGGREQELADALEAATLTSAEDQMYVKRMEAERDAEKWAEGALWAAVECGAIPSEHVAWLVDGDNPYETKGGSE